MAKRREYKKSNRITNVIEARRPDMVIIDKTKYECKIIDFTCPSIAELREGRKIK